MRTRIKTHSGQKIMRVSGRKITRLAAIITIGYCAASCTSKQKDYVAKVENYSVISMADSAHQTEQKAWQLCERK